MIWKGPPAVDWEMLLRGILLLVSSKSSTLTENAKSRIETHRQESHFSVLQYGPSTVSSTSTLSAATQVPSSLQSHP